VLAEPPNPIEVADLLQGDNSEQAFAELVREHATSGVSGILPKFLDTDDGSNDTSVDISASLDLHPKATLFTRRHIIKGSSGRLPFAALNEYLCMQVVGKVLRSAKTEVSRDGNALVVHRFDVDDEGHPLWGMEDFCALLGLRPAAKYETTWERIAWAVRDHVPGGEQYETFRRLATMLLLTYAVRNADCHAKNLVPCCPSGASEKLRSRRSIIRCQQGYEGRFISLSQVLLQSLQRSSAKLQHARQFHV
jgi:serine/threonine-protein kinase HipA